MQVANAVTGGTTWSVGDEWAIGIVQAPPLSQVQVSIGASSWVVGCTDQNGNFSSYGIATQSNVGTVTEVCRRGRDRQSAFRHDQVSVTNRATGPTSSSKRRAFSCRRGECLCLTGWYFPAEKRL